METKLKLKENHTSVCLAMKCLVILYTEGWTGRSKFHTYPFKYQYFLNQICQFTYYPIRYLLSSFQTRQTSSFFLQGTVCRLNFKRYLSASLSGREICINYSRVTLASAGKACLDYWLNQEHNCQKIHTSYLCIYIFTTPFFPYSSIIFYIITAANRTVFWERYKKPIVCSQKITCH